MPSSQLSALSSQLSALTVILAIAATLRSQAPIPFSTHDHTTTVGSPINLTEGWADVKVPGDGRVYAVGSIDIETADVNDNPTFSGSPIREADFHNTLPQNWWEPSFLGSTATKQVVVLQCSNEDGTIAWQNFYYGDSQLPPSPSQLARGTNARGISVWAGPTEEETRIAICGESHEAELPRSAQAPWSQTLSYIGPAGPMSVLNGLPSGFIAVYNGLGELLWSYEFRFDQHLGQCAVTDVSIRVVDSPSGKRDVVTYCGISSFGVPAGTTGESLSPLLPFDLSAQVTTGFTPANGDTDNGSGQWDGFVGRISNGHTNPLASQTTREFHSVVGGRHQDGLWGIAELDDDRFAVVGGSAVPTNGVAGAPSFPFTFTAQQTWDMHGDYCVGVLMVFDAAPTRLSSPQPLVLDKSTSLGSIGTQNSHARDVVVHLEPTNDAQASPDKIVVVGTTDDDSLFGSLTGAVTPTTAFQGGTDGFLVATDDEFPILFVFDEGTYQGAVGDSGFTGVAAWNEYLDHVGVVGHVLGDLWIGSYWADGPTGSLPALLRSRLVASASVETPAAMGAQHATDPAGFTGGSGLAYEDFGLGSPAGGAIAVDERARFHVTGSTTGGTYPTVGANARGWLGGVDAIRSTFDMLPARVGRSDQTGELTHNGVTIPPAPAGMTGRTTPTPALEPFGRRPNEPTPGARLRRMMIDWEGGAPAQTVGSNPEHFILVDRPPPTSSLAIAVIRFGVATPPGAFGPGLTEDWVTGAVSATHSVWVGYSGTLRIGVTLPPPIPGGVTYAMQVATADLGPYSCGGCDIFAGSPAIVFSY